MTNRGPVAPQEYYHVYNRGTEKRKIFLTKSDYERFLVLLYLSNGSKPIQLNNYRGSTSVELLQIDRGVTLVDIIAYCLMPNHFHLLLRQHTEGGISKFMQKMSTGYTMYFNVKNKRSGALFQGRYKSVHAGDDRYLKYLFSYIHLNPKQPRTYTYSSYSYFVGKENIWNRLLNTQNTPLYFKTPEEFEEEMTEWLGYAKTTEVQPR